VDSKALIKISCPCSIIFVLLVITAILAWVFFFLSVASEKKCLCYCDLISCLVSNQSQLVRILYFLQDLAKEEKTEDVKELASAANDASGCKEDIVFNPNVFTEFKLAGSPEVYF
jgi:hypothetical protein